MSQEERDRLERELETIDRELQAMTPRARVIRRREAELMQALHGWSIADASRYVDVSCPLCGWNGTP